MRFLIGLDQLSLGSRTNCDLLDSSGAVVVPGGTTVSPDLLNELRSLRLVGLFSERQEFLQPALPPRVVDMKSIVPVVQEMQARAGIDPVVDGTTRREAMSLARETHDAARLGQPIDCGAIEDLVRHIDMELRSRGSRFFKSQVEDYGQFYLQSHSVNVMLAILMMASKLGFGEKETRRLAVGAFLHDIGKVKIDAAILEKPSVLSDEEFDEVRRHPFLGLKVVMRGLEIGDDACRLVLHHHERFDGKGYPMRLGRETISDGGRLMAILDAFDAMTSYRVYAPKLTSHQAVQQIIAGSGTQFDPQYARKFLAVTGSYPDGSAVELNTGEIGIVTGQNRNSIIRPRVELFFGPSHRPLLRPKEIDLSADSARFIKGEVQQYLH